MEDTGRPKAKAKPRAARRAWLWVILLLLLALLALLLLRRCLPSPPERERPAPEPLVWAPPPPGEAILSPPMPDLPKAPAKPPAPPPAPKPPPPDTPAAETPAPDTGQPYLYADPWGGRHYDSVVVELFCREDCLILYSLTDSVNFQTYEDPITLRRSSRLWLSGINTQNRQVEPVPIDYAIERNPGLCRENMMPFEFRGGTVCMDVFEWPNREDEPPSTFVSRAEAADSCASTGKRLCSLEEWRLVCRGPAGEKYPYGNRYNENHCPAKEVEARRSGRFPVCRSYYGIQDLTGNVWEWTSTPAAEREGFYMVAGGHWDAGNEATCQLAKYSFYPQNRYPFVGFRCCEDVRAGNK